LCSGADGTLQYFDDDDYDEHFDDGLKPIWSLPAWGNQPLLYTSAIIHEDNAFMPKFVKGQVGTGYAWSDAEVHVLFSHSHIINFGHAMFDDIYGVFKGMHTFNRYSYSDSQLVLMGGCVGRSSSRQYNYGDAEGVRLTNSSHCEKVFGHGGWSSGISRRPAVALHPMTCYRNAIVGSTAAYGLWYLNNDAAFDVAHFASSFLLNYMDINRNADGNTGMLRKRHQRQKQSVFKSCSLEYPTVLIIKSSKLRAHAIASGTHSTEVFIPSPWNTPDIERVTKHVLQLSDACVKIVDLQRLHLRQQIAAVRAAEIIITPDGGVSYIVAFAAESSAVLVLTCQAIKDTHTLPYWAFLSTIIHLHCGDQVRRLTDFSAVFQKVF
jgi:hypothetical protein